MNVNNGLNLKTHIPVIVQLLRKQHLHKIIVKFRTKLDLKRKRLVKISSMTSIQNVKEMSDNKWCLFVRSTMERYRPSLTRSSFNLTYQLVTLKLIFCPLR